MSSTAAQSAGSAPEEQRRVLVVDDNVDGAESMALMLELLGYVTRSAHDGPSALAAAPEFAPDAVLLDIGLPGMSGYEVARALRAQPQFQGTLLVALTGWGGEEDKRRCRDAGFDLHLTKPVDVDSVAQVLAKPR